jgi:endonuclease/exonuclease/phosphatase family metal-dependent hydrolase
MKTLSWNILKNNKDQISSFNKIVEKENPDILCLQEVNTALLKYLQSINKWIVYTAKDFLDNRGETYYLVTLLKHNFNIVHFQIKSTLPVSNAVITNYYKIKPFREILIVEFINKNQNYYILNYHLEIACGPGKRIHDFNNGISGLNKNNNIIACGDFNIFSNFFTAILVGWCFGYKFKDYYINERKLFEKKFRELNLTNIFKNKITFPLLRLQLDHILVSSNTIIDSKYVSRKLYNSDHYYITIKTV